MWENLALCEIITIHKLAQAINEAIWLNTAVQKSHITIASSVCYSDDCWSQWLSKYCTYTGCHWWLCCSPLGPLWHGSSWVWLPDSPSSPLTSVVSRSQTQTVAAVAPAASNSATVAPMDRIHTEHKYTKRSGKTNKTVTVKCQGHLNNRLYLFILHLRDAFNSLNAKTTYIMSIRHYSFCFFLCQYLWCWLSDFLTLG